MLSKRRSRELISCDPVQLNFNFNTETETETETADSRQTQIQLAKHTKKGLLIIAHAEIHRSIGVERYRDLLGVPLIYPSVDRVRTTNTSGVKMEEKLVNSLNSIVECVWII